VCTHAAFAAPLDGLLPGLSFAIFIDFLLLWAGSPHIAWKNDLLSNMS